MRGHREYAVVASWVRGVGNRIPPRCQLLSDDRLMEVSVRIRLCHARHLVLFLGLAAACGRERSGQTEVQPQFTSAAPAPIDTGLATFTALTSIRKLADGRVLLSDPRERSLFVADGNFRHAEQLGRVGDGPGEYRLAAPLWRLRGDSTLMIDMFGRRWLILIGARIVATVPPTNPAVLAVRSYGFSLDSLGKILLLQNGATAADSQVMILLDRATGAQTAIGHLPPPVPGSDVVPAYPHVYVSVGMSPDGWIAIVYPDPYRVDWRDPAGRWVRGPTLDVPVIPVTDEERDFVLDRQRAGSRPDVQADELQWPRTIPVVNTRHQMIFAPTGELLVPRVPSARSPEASYDVIDRRGALVGSLRLKVDEHILGQADRELFVVSVREDGFQVLRSVAWPGDLVVSR